MSPARQGAHVSLENSAFVRTSACVCVWVRARMGAGAHPGARVDRGYNTHVHSRPRMILRLPSATSLGPRFSSCTPFLARYLNAKPRFSSFCMRICSGGCPPRPRGLSRGGREIPTDRRRTGGGARLPSQDPSPPAHLRSLVVLAAHLLAAQHFQQVDEGDAAAQVLVQVRDVHLAHAEVHIDPLLEGFRLQPHPIRVLCVPNHSHTTATQPPRNPHANVRRTGRCAPWLTPARRAQSPRSETLRTRATHLPRLSQTCCSEARAPPRHSRRC